MAKKKNDDSENENLNNDSDDSFGLPEINYEPLAKKESKVEQEPEPEPEPEPVYETESVETNEYAEQEEQQPVEEETYEYKPYDEEEPSVWPKVLGILLIVVLALGAAWWLLIYQPKQKEAAEKARIEAEAKAKLQKEKDDEANRLRLEREAAEKRRLDSLEAIKTPPAGTIETLSERTGRYYVVVASALDRDLLMDYAKKLGAKGLSSKIIPPYGKYKVSRITIADGDTFAAAQQKADELKAEYGDAVWVLKY